VSDIEKFVSIADGSPITTQVSEHTDESHQTFAIEDQLWGSGVRIEISEDPRQTDPILVITSLEHSGLIIQAPLPEWELTQVVDDQSLFTELELATESDSQLAGVGIVGPDATQTDDGITLINEDDSEYLFTESDEIAQFP